jgi:hypothetical protein
VNIDERSAERLEREAQLAARIRTLKTDADVVALYVERKRTLVLRLLWAAVILGLLFTLVNVQQFASAGSAVGSFTWLTAWLLDPMVSLPLVAFLTAEVLVARYKLRLDFWAQAGKWLTLGLAYLLNTWASWSAGSPAQILLHSVPVLIVFVATQAAPGIQGQLTEAVIRAAEEASQRASQTVSSFEQPVAPATPQGLTPLASSNLVVPPAIPVAQPVAQPQPVVSPLEPVARPVPVRPAPSQTASDPTDAQLAAALRKDWVKKGQRPGSARMAKELEVSRTKIEKLLAEMPDPASSNGHREAVSR